MEHAIIAPKPNSVGVLDIQYVTTLAPVYILAVSVLMYLILFLMSFMVIPDNIANKERRDVVEVILLSVATLTSLFTLGYWWKTIFSLIWNSKTGIFMNLFLTAIIFQFILMILGILNITGVTGEYTDSLYFLFRLVEFILVLIVCVIYTVFLIPGMISDNKIGLGL